MIARWLAGVAVNVNQIIRNEEDREKFVQNIAGYAEGAGVKWGHDKAFESCDFQKMIRGVSSTSVESDMLFNVKLLAQALSLSALEAEVLALAVALRCDGEFSTALDQIEIRGHYQAMRVLQAMLSCTMEEVRQLSAENAMLSRLQLVTFHGDYLFRDRVAISNTLCGALSGSRTDLATMLGSIFTIARPASLDRGDFAHMEKDITLVLQYLTAALQNRRKGCNLLLVGLPGTGKTELARLVATELKCIGAEVKSVDENNTPASARERLSSYSLAQALLSPSRQHVIIFDEMEDLFSDEAERSHYKPFGKRWFNDALEENATPTIWIANSVDAVDVAHLRRFDFTIRFDTLPKKARGRVIAKHLGDLKLNDQQRNMLIQREQLLPSQVSMAAKVAAMVGKPELSSDIVMRVVNNSMSLLNQAIEPHRHIAFDLSLVNADTCLATLIEGLRVMGEARICLTGPAGTGKTAFAYYLAEILDIGIIKAKASALFSPYVGGTEQRIAKLFKAASAENKLLLFDEADSVLNRRDDAESQWEVTAVNEMLTQLDDFTGIACFTTNRMNALDRAALRRFDFKVNFSYLTNAQRTALFDETSGTEKLSACERARLQNLTQLNLGDFAAIKRKQRIVGKHWTAQDWLAALESEHAFKTTPKQSVGFASH